MSSDDSSDDSSDSSNDSRAPTTAPMTAPTSAPTTTLNTAEPRRSPTTALTTAQNRCMGTYASGVQCFIHPGFSNSWTITTKLCGGSPCGGWYREGASLGHLLRWPGPAAIGSFICQLLGAVDASELSSLSLWVEKTAIELGTVCSGP